MLDNVERIYESIVAINEDGVRVGHQLATIEMGILPKIHENSKTQQNSMLKQTVLIDN